MMDWPAFHNKAKAAKPPEELPAKRYWIGVLFHDKSPDQLLQQDDFLWMKAHARISVEIILTQYKQRYPSTDVDLTCREDVNAKTIIKDLNFYGDNIVIFRAVEKRVPLRPISRQVSHMPTAVISTLPSPVPVKAEPGDFEPSLLDYKGAVPTTPVSADKENGPTTRWQMPSHGADDQHQHLASAAASLHCPSNRQTSTTPLAPVRRKSPARTASSELSSVPTTAVKAERTPSHPPTSPEPEPLAATFDPEDVFAKDPSPGIELEPEAKPSDVFVRQLIDQQDPDLLEAGVAQAIKVLDTLKGSFLRYAAVSADAQSWIKAIDKLKLQAERKRTVVGVVGNTGAGKSSVINAILDEERLVPTNCMRACTAVVTELSWNDSKDPYSKYRAEIEFISRADWEKELGALMKEFLTENGTVSRETSDQNSDAGIAWAKFHAVYPKKTKEMLADCTVTSLMSERSVLDVLGTTKKINKSEPGSFYTELQRYVDSKEKATGKDKDKKDKKKSASQIEYWPLIKVVKIHTKADALSTGAVIVDLPGVHDSNAARAAVAQGYMKQCTGLWIVAPITRAVDDKAAKSLLGDSFKRQLKYDGGFSAVTFICSKTDDISITEATESLELDEEISGLDDQERERKRKIKDLQGELEKMRDLKAVYKQAGEEAEDDIETWDDLKDNLNDGKTVYAPTIGKSKRKNVKPDKSRKRRRADSDADDKFIASDSDSSTTDSDSEMEEIQPPRQPLTAEDIEARLEELKETKKNARRQRLEIEPRMKGIQSEIKETKQKLADVRAEMSAICIAGRNDYSKGAIQLDFAAGIKELDQENAVEEDEENFNPDKELRDYDEVARSLPVFCVSSRAYQKMCDRLQKDDGVPGFKTKEETEIPQLQAHCKKLTEAGRIKTCRAFLLNLCQQLNTFSFWASDDGSGLKLTDDEKRKQVNYLDKRLEELEKGLFRVVECCIQVMKKEMHDQIFEKYPEVIEEAINAAPATARKWGARKDEGGLFWATYKAIVRRDGAYQSSSAGFRDFNSELVDPITKRLATGWERAFQNRLPKAFELYTKDSSRLLHHFHDKIEERARQNGVGLANLAMLKNQIYTFEQLFVELNGQLVTAMNELQRDANRDFTPTIVATMHTVYDVCTEERGTGSFMRMKGHMNDHVDRVRYQMFTTATDTVKSHLNQMCKTLQGTMEEKADEIFLGMRRDYMSVLGGVQVNPDAVMSREEREMRAEIKPVLLGVDERFKSIVNREDEEQVEDKAQVGDEEMDVDEAEAGPSEVRLNEEDDNVRQPGSCNEDASAFASASTDAGDMDVTESASKEADSHDNTDEEDEEA